MDHIGELSKHWGHLGSFHLGVHIFRSIGVNGLEVAKRRF